MKKINSFLKAKEKKIKQSVYAIVFVHQNFGRYMVIDVAFSLDEFISEKRKMIAKEKNIEPFEIQVEQYVWLSEAEVVSKMFDLNVNMEEKAEEDTNKLMKDLILLGDIKKVEENNKLSEEQKKFVIDKINNK